MVYLAWLLDVMTDRLRIVRIRARNVPRKRTQALYNDAFLASLSLQESDDVARWCAEVPFCWNIKYRLRTSNACLPVASERESCPNSMPFSLWHQIWAIWL